MEHANDTPGIRKSRFLWMNEHAQKRYLDALRKRIATGFFYSDTIVSRVVEEIAPVLREAADGN